MAVACAKAGQTKRAQGLVQLMEQDQGKGVPVSPYRIAAAHAALDRTDLAFTWLDRALDQRDPLIIFFMKTNPDFAAMESDPRYSRLMGRMGLVAATAAKETYK